MFSAFGQQQRPMASQQPEIVGIPRGEIPGGNMPMPAGQGPLFNGRPMYNPAYGPQAMGGLSPFANGAIEAMPEVLPQYRQNVVPTAAMPSPTSAPYANPNQMMRPGMPAQMSGGGLFGLRNPMGSL